MISKKTVKPAFEQAYVTIMMDVIGRGLVMASQVDAEIQQEIAQFPVGFILSMQVFPQGPAFIAEVTAQQQLKLLSHSSRKPDLSIRFKHMNHAFLVFSFQESTSKAFANDRMVADGDLAYAICLVRCLNKMEALILPKILAQYAVKQYPKNLSLKEKVKHAGNIYFKVAQSYLKRSA